MNNWQKAWRKGFAGALIFSMCLQSVAHVDFVAAAKKTAVKSIQITSPAISTLAMKKGEKVNVKVKVSPRKAKKNITFSSSRKKIVTVSKTGALKAKKTGKATITVTSTTKPKKKAKINVTVYKTLKKVKKVSLKEKAKTLAVGKTTKLKATVSPKKATVKGVSYVSGNKRVATVSASGTVTAKKAGTTKITAYAKDGRGAKAVCTITVVEKELPSVTVQPEQPVIYEQLKQTEKDAFIIANETLATNLYIDEKGSDYAGLKYIADSFAGDVDLVTNDTVAARVYSKLDDINLNTSAIIVGSIGNNDVIDALIKDGRIDVSDVKDKREVYKIQVVDNPTDRLEKAIVVVGSEKRGAIYGLYHISEMMGVSPWYYWADATPAKSSKVSFSYKDLATTSKEPTVKYRGIFLNDEAPSLTGWVTSKFGGYNEKFYQKVFELILRCKGNYLWPAMWSNCFSSDGKSRPSANIRMANDYGVVMGTSHHEPMCRAGVEWQRRYKAYSDSNAWNFITNAAGITKFWEDGIERNKAFENVITLGMRGEADSALEGSVSDNINNLKNVITVQKNILEQKGLSDVPTVLTVYKEVEDYWHGKDGVKGLKEWDQLDDVTIMLCDDNYGNMRTLPTAEEKDRKGGWGMYYHFDYHGGPTSYEWVNTIELNKVWEQMTMAYDHGIDDIWIVNVGDLKPMEMNISYFLDMAYDYETWGKNGANKTEQYMSEWLKKQFAGVLTEEQNAQLTQLYEDYTWVNTAFKPEALKSDTYSVVNYNESREMLARLNDMMERGDECEKFIPNGWKAAYFQLIYYPAMASANVARMQIFSGLNKYFAKQKSTNANFYADLLEASITYDKTITNTYNNKMPEVGKKWSKMMSSPHVGYVTWNSDGWAYPTAERVTGETSASMFVNLENQASAVKEGNATLDTFTNLNNETYTITLSNGGTTAYDYTATASADWIKLEKTAGVVEIQDTIGVSVDWTKVTEDSTGTVTISGAGKTVTITVNATVISTEGLSDKTFIYANGYASILPGHFAASGKGTNNAEILVLDKYGKMGQSLKAVASDIKLLTKAEDAAYVDYKVYMPEAGSYKLTTYTAPSGNLSRDAVSIHYAISVNEATPKILNTVDESTFRAGEYSGSWQYDVQNSGRTKETTITLNKGENTIRVYAMDASFLLQKLVVSKKSVLKSHFGPRESYYVGK